jgi:acyl dehydratase
VFERVLGADVGWRKIEYNWRDMALYALAVGADENDLLYTYEKNMKAIPSFVAVPYYSAVNNTPQQPRPYPANYLALDLMRQETGENLAIAPHLGFQIEMKRPVDPIKGTLVFNGRVDKIFDRGPGKGADLEIKSEVYDEAGNLLAINTSYHRVRGVGGWGGEAPVKKVVEFPDREPDRIVDSYISKTQNVLYRLNGDTNLSHIDPELCKSVADRPFMQGLSSLGFVTRMIIKAFIPGEPERMKRIYVQMRSVAFPDTPVQVRAWQVGDGKAVFRYIDLNTGKVILDNCEFEWE